MIHLSSNQPELTFFVHFNFLYHFLFYTAKFFFIIIHYILFYYYLLLLFIPRGIFGALRLCQFIELFFELMF